jgi:hypothetical protein
MRGLFRVGVLAFSFSVFAFAQAKPKASEPSNEEEQIKLLVELVDVLRKDNQRLKALSDAWHLYSNVCSASATLQPLDAALDAKIKQAEETCLKSKGTWSKETLGCSNSK